LVYTQESFFYHFISIFPVVVPGNPKKSQVNE
jgi:hypothetical protein